MFFKKTTARNSLIAHKKNTAPSNQPDKLGSQEGPIDGITSTNRRSVHAAAILLFRFQSLMLLPSCLAGCSTTKASIPPLANI
jgi:hypothetical protein